MRRPTWTCDTCHQPTQTGWITCDWQQAARSPQPAHWHTTCDQCDLGLTVHESRWQIAGLQTWHGVTRWLTTLGPEHWFTNTNWPDLINRAGARNHAQGEAA